MTKPRSPLFWWTAAAMPCLIWSFGVVISGELVKAFGPLISLGLEFLIGGSILLLAAIFKGDARAMLGHRLRYYLVCGGCWIGNFVLFILGIAATTEERELIAVGLINYLWPSLTVLCAVLLLKRRANLFLPLGLLLTICGIVMGKVAVSPLGVSELTAAIAVDPNLLAYSLVFVCAVAWAVYSNLSVLYATPGLPGAVPLFMLAASLPLILTGVLTGEVLRHSSGPGLWSDLALVSGWAVATGSASLIWDIGARHGRVVLFGTFSMLIPFLSTVLTAWGSGVEMGVLVLGSGMFVVLGSFCARWGVEE